MLGQMHLPRRKAPQNGSAVLSAAVLTVLVEQADVRDALLSFRTEFKWIDDMHLQVCRIPAPTFLEEKRAEWVAAQLRSLGWDAKLDRAGNVVALFGPDRGEPLVALTAHLDTVLAPREPEDIRVDDDGRFRGPGVSDNGSGLAALFAMARAFAIYPQAAGSGARLLLVANVCEEGEGNLNGMRYLCTKSPLAGRLRSFIVLDGPNVEHITAEALACRRFEITIQGPGGHSWSDHGAPNPVHAISRLVTQYCDLRAEASPDAPRHSYNFGVAEGGSSINAIPSSAMTKVDLRSEEGAYLDEMVAQIAAVAQSVIQAENQRAPSGRLTLRMREAGSRPGGALDADAPLLAAVRSVDAHLGIYAHLDCASTDANLPLSIGLAAVSIGAGGKGGGAHTPAEWYHPAGRDLGLRRVYLALRLMLEHTAPSA